MMISRFIENRDVKLKLKKSIAQLVHYLYHKFGITRQEIKSQLYWKFKTRERHLKYDPSRSNLEVYIGYFTYYALLDLVCECKRCKEKCPEIPLSQLPYGESVSTIGRPADSLEIDGLIDYETPQDMVMGKELNMDFRDLYDSWDLRWVCQRIGICGGQKAIENQIGFRRKEDTLGMSGRDAIYLWEKFKNGNQKALETLLEYNAEDLRVLRAIKRYLQRSGCLTQY